MQGWNGIIFVLLLPKNDPDITFAKVLEMAEKQGIYTVFPMERLIQRQQLKFLWKITHLKDTAVQKRSAFGGSNCNKLFNISVLVCFLSAIRQKIYVCFRPPRLCFPLFAALPNKILSNFGVTMDDCGKMDQTD